MRYCSGLVLRLLAANKGFGSLLEYRQCDCASCSVPARYRPCCISPCRRSSRLDQPLQSACRVSPRPPSLSKLSLSPTALPHPPLGPVRFRRPMLHPATSSGCSRHDRLVLALPSCFRPHGPRCPANLIRRQPPPTLYASTAAPAIAAGNAILAGRAPG